MTITNPRVEAINNGADFVVNGTVCFDNVLKLRYQGNDLIDRIEKQDISVDLSEVSSQDASILSLLLRLVCYASSQGKHLHFLSLPASLTKMVRVCGISDLLSD